MLEAGERISLTSIREGDRNDVHTVEEEPSPPENIVTLPRVDGGKEAWLFLAACFIVEVMTWGEVTSSLLRGKAEWHECVGDIGRLG